MTKKNRSNSERFFRALLRVFPFDFRWKHGREMEQVFRQRRREEEGKGGSMGTLRLWWETLVDIARTAPREHLEMLAQDTRYALRTMRKNPGFTTVAVLTLALGIGANTAIFSVVNAVLLRPLPFGDGDRLVRVYLVPEGKTNQISPRASVFLAVREQATSFESVAGQRYSNFSVITSEGPERVAGMHVSEGWLQTLRVEPVIGRGASPEEEKQGTGSRVVLISHRLWNRRFGWSPEAVGRSLVINGQSYTVVGVMPRGFQYPYDNDIWIPTNFRSETFSSWGMNIQARLKQAVSLEEARVELALLTRQLVQQSEGIHPGEILTPVPTRKVLLGENSGQVVALMAAVGFVLLIACVNMGNLLLARSAARQKEMAIRGALGAGRLRQVRQLLTESVLLSLIGGSLGVGIAVWASRFLAVLIPGRLGNLLDEVAVDFSVLAFALAVAVGAGVLFGLFPALYVSRPDLQQVLKEGGRSSQAVGSHRVFSALVVSEVALALVLLVGAGLMIRNFERLYQTDLGYPAEGLLTLSLTLESERYSDPQARRLFAGRVVEEIRSLPEVEVAGGTTMFPIDHGNLFSAIQIEGLQLEPDQQNLVNNRLVTPGFLEALGVPLLRGRLLTPADRNGSPLVAVVGESLARRYWPGEDAIGKRLRNIRSEAAHPWVTVVGVVGDVREFYDVAESWYLPYDQNAAGRAAAQLILAVRAQGVSPGLVQRLREAVWRIDPGLPVFDVATLEEQYSEALSEQRLGMLLTGLFAALGLLLASLGLYGVLSYAASRRTHEIGVRMALGAQPGDILLWMLQKGTVLVLLGLAMGLAGAFALTRFMSSLLTEIEATDPATFAVVSAVLAGVALLACYVPASRATKVDPMVALRHE